MAAAIAFAVAVVLAYRWAGPSKNWTPPRPGGGASVTIRLLDTPFAAYIDGARVWSIHAGQVDILRMPNASLTSVQSATILNIRNGTLYDPPTRPVSSASAATARVMEAGAPDRNSGPIGATFHAKQGRYSAGMLETIPADLAMLYTVQWQFRLDGDVVFKTRSGDVLTAPAMTIYNLVSRKTGRPEQRVMCDKGGRMIHKGIEVTANTLRYNPKERTVDLYSGVRGVYKNGSVQAERVYWSLDNEILRCPETATGKIQGMPFTADGITLDIKHRKHHATRAHIDVNSNSINRLEE
jgi:hypothetical protein